MLRLFRPALAALLALSLIAPQAAPAQHQHSTSPAPAAAAQEPESTRAMGQRLRAIYHSTDWKSDPNKTAERAAYYDRILREQKLSPADELTVREQLSTELLRSGDPEAALKALDRTLDGPEALATQLHLPKQARRDLLHQRAITFLRLGETENCLAHHGAHSCVFPIRAGGVHTLPRGAEGAVRDFTSLLNEDPHDDLARWLLNVAYMQLGRYPQAVPPRYLLPLSLFQSDRDEPVWPDMAALSGIDLTTRSGGAVVEDFDGDGLLDIVTSTSDPLGPMHLFHNNGDGTFSDRTAAAGLADELGGLNLVVTDYDNDGHPDILVLRGAWWGRFGEYPLSLLHNRGDGSFEDVTVRAGLLTFGPTQTAAWADFDNDGYLDLFVGHENNPGNLGNMNSSTGPNPATATHSSTTQPPSEHYPSQLFHNNGDGTFTDVARELGLAEQGFVKGVAWGDFNNDGRPDLYISTKTGENRLYRNDGPAPSTALSKDPQQLDSTRDRIGPSSSHNTNASSFRPKAALFAAGVQKPAVPAQSAPSHASATEPPSKPGITHWRFTDVTAQSGLADQHNTFATWFFDYDNDGWPDLFVAGYSAGSMQDVGKFEAGHPADAGLPHLYHNNRNGTFTDVAHDLHLDRAILTMGANFGDIDNDGFLDLYLGTGEPSYEALLPNRLLRNNSGKRFEDITTATGLGHLQKGHSIAFADIENRGLEDIFEEMGGAFPGDPYQSALYRNPLPDPTAAATLSSRPKRSEVEKPAVPSKAPTASSDTRTSFKTNHSITLKLEGTHTNRAAFGTRIDLLITEPASNGKPIHRHIYRTVGNVSSFGGNPLMQHIGIGQATTVDEVRLRWPSTYPAEQIFRNLPADRLYRLTEADPTPHPITQPHFHLGDHLAPEHRHDQ